MDCLHVPSLFGREKEVAMFQMIHEERPSAEDRKMFWLKAGLIVVALAFMGGVVYFFALVPYHR